jgi:hypothetical protein
MYARCSLKVLQLTLLTRNIWKVFCLRIKRLSQSRRTKLPWIVGINILRLFYLSISVKSWTRSLTTILMHPLSSTTQVFGPFRTFNTLLSIYVVLPIIFHIDGIALNWRNWIYRTPVLGCLRMNWLLTFMNHLLLIIWP